MARRHRGRGKRVTGLEMGFVMCQTVTIMLLLGVLMMYVSARIRFKPGVEYLPVTITYTMSEAHTRTYTKDGKHRTETVHDNSYYYIVDGIRYEGEEKK